MKSLAAFVVLSICASCCYAATVQGVIFDEETKNPLARTRVTLVPLPGTSGAATSLLANDHGEYGFAQVHPGWYLVRAMRVGYEVAEFGQSRPGLPGVPFEVKDQTSGDRVDLHQILMRHQAAITGTVVDDNSIGIPGWEVTVYTARQPIRRVAQGMTDDRGNFRIGELEAGDYIVRSGGGGLEDASTLVPSYYKYGTALANAEIVRVRLGETAAFVVVHTVEGRLYDLTGELTAPDKRPVRLTLITDTGRRMIASNAGPFTATGVPPGKVELLAEAAGCAGYQTLIVDRNMFARIDCAPVASPIVTGVLSFPLMARRMDLDGPGREIAVSAGQTLSPGYWEFTMHPGPSHYLVSIQNEGDSTPHGVAWDGWFGLDLGNAPRLQVTLSDKPASISGVVSSPSGPVIGAPVFLEMVNPDAPELALGSWSVRADPQGYYVFNGLAPGGYRFMSSFDVDFDDLRARDKAATVTLREGDTVIQSLEMIAQ